MTNELDFRPDQPSDDLLDLLEQLEPHKETVGSLLVAHDGTILAYKGFDKIEAEKIGIWALGFYMHSEHVAKKMRHDRVHQILSRTANGYTIIVDFGAGLLVVVSNGEGIISHLQDFDLPQSSKHRIE